MSFWSSVGNFVRGVAAQVNPFDGGANYSSVQRAARRKKRDEEQQVKQRAPLGTKNGRPIQGPTQKPLKIKSYLRNDPKNLTQIQAPKIKIQQVQQEMARKDKARKLQQLARQVKTGQINEAQRTAAAQRILGTQPKGVSIVDKALGIVPKIMESGVKSVGQNETRRLQNKARQQNAEGQVDKLLKAKQMLAQLNRAGRLKPSDFKKIDKDLNQAIALTNVERESAGEDAIAQDIANSKAVQGTGLVKSIFNDTLRSGVAAGQELEALLPGEKVSKIVPKGKLQKALLGDKPIRGFEGVGEDIGITKNKKANYALGALFAGLDIVPGGGSIRKKVIKELAQESDEVLIKSTLKTLAEDGAKATGVASISDDVIDDISRQIAKANDPKQVEKLLKEVNSKTPLPKESLLKEDDVAEMGKQAREEAKSVSESKIPKGQKFRDFISQKFTDDTAYFQKLDRQLAKGKKTRVKNISANERVDPLIQEFRNVESAKIQKRKDLGIEEWAKDFSNEETYNKYLVYNRYRTNVERAAVNKGPGESLESAYARFTGGKNLADDAAAFKTLENDPFYDAKFRQHNKIANEIIRARGASNDLKITPAEVEEIIARYPNFTPQSRVFSEDVPEFKRGSTPGGMQGANVEELKEGSTVRPLDDPIEALVGYSDDLVSKESSNRVMNALLAQQRSKFRPIYTADDAKRKEASKVFLEELGSEGKSVNRLLKTNKRLARRLETELNRLNKEGINMSLSQADEPSLSGKAAGIDVKTTPAEVKNLMESLVNTRNADLQRIISKIGRREPKLKAQLEEVAKLAYKADDLKAQKASVLDSGALDQIGRVSNLNTRRRVIDGYEEIFEVTDPRLAQNLRQLGESEISEAAKVIGVPTRAFRFFTTGAGNATYFVPIAIARDIFSSILFSRAPARALLDPNAYIAGFKAAAKRGDFFEALRRKGIGGELVEATRGAEAATSAALRNRGLKRIKLYAKNPKTLLRDVENVESGAERFTRGRLAYARYKQSLSKNGGDIDAALADAAESYREDAVNFGRGGKVTREINQAAEYLNPAVQAGNLIRRRFLESKAGFTVRASIAATIVGGAVAWNLADPDRKKVYEQINPEDKLNNLVIVTDDSKYNEDTGEVTGILKWPLSQELRPILTGIEELYANSNEDDYGKMALSGLSAITGLDMTSVNKQISQLVPSYAEKAFENVANYSLYKDDKLVPDYIKDEAGGDVTKEATKSTTGTAELIGKQFGMSPIKVQNFIQGLTGGATADILSNTDKILAKLGKIENPSESKGRLLKRLTTSYGESSGVKFFKQVENLSKNIKNPDDRKIFEGHFAKNPEPGLLDSAEKANNFLNRPDVYEAHRKLDQWNRKNGKPGNPLFELSPEERKKVLGYRAGGLYSAGKQNYNKDGSPAFIEFGLDSKWYNKFRDKETKFYSKIKKDSIAKLERQIKNAQTPQEKKEFEKELKDLQKNKSFKTFSGEKKPKLSKALEKVQNTYFGLPKDQRKDFLNAHPELLKYWADSEGFTNKERKAIGLKVLEDDSGYGKYGKYGKGGGKDGDSVNIPTIQNFLTGNLNNAPRVKLAQVARQSKVRIPTGVPKSRIKINIAGNKRPTFGGPTRNR